MAQQLPPNGSPAMALIGAMYSATLPEGQAPAGATITMAQASAVAAALAPLLPLATLVKETVPAVETYQMAFSKVMLLRQLEEDEQLENVKRAKLENVKLEAEIEIEVQRQKSIELKAKLANLRQPYARPTTSAPGRRNTQRGVKKSETPA